MAKIKNALLIAIISFNLRIALTSIMANIAIIQADLTLTNFQGGLLTSVPLICMGLFALLVNQVQKRFGQRLGIGLFSVWLGLGSLMRFGANSYLLLLASTVIVGSGIAIIGPLVSGFIKRYFPDNANIMVAVYTSMMGIGSVLVSASSPWLLQVSGSWQATVGIWGVIPILAAIIWLIFSPRTTDEIIMPIAEASEPDVEEDVSTLNLWRNLIVWQLIFLYGAQSGANYTYSTWIQPYAVSQGLTAVFGSMLVSIFTAVQTVANFTVPLLVTRPGKLKIWTLICGGMIVLGAFAMLIGGQYSMVAIGATVLMAYGGAGIFNICLIIPIRISTTPEKASVTTSLMQTVGYLVGAMAPILVGQIIDLTGSSNVLIFLMLLAGGSVIFLAYGKAIKLAN